MQAPDFLNGLFEAIGGVLVWLNVRRIWIDREVKGTEWKVMFFFTAWGVWNLWYYPHLDQWVSFVGGLVMVVANIVWVTLVIRFRKAKL